MDSVSWLQNGYELVSTLDGSPTLRALLSAGAEDMHHSGGAWSETRQIYGRLIAPAFEALEHPRFLSLGLGLGYNETLIAQHALKFKKPWSCVSYESDPVLIQAFKLALEDRHPAGEIQETYARIFGAIEEPVKDELLGALAEGRWILEGALTPGGPSGTALSSRRLSLGRVLAKDEPGSLGGVVLARVFCEFGLAWLVRTVFLRVRWKLEAGAEGVWIQR